VAAVLVAAPVYVTLASLGAPLLTRINDQGITGEYWAALLLSSADEPILQEYTRHLIEPFLFPYHLRDASLFYAGGVTLLHLLTPAFLMGAALALWRLRRPAFVLLLLWMGLTALGNTFLADTAQSPRYVVAFPAWMLLAAAGIDVVARHLSRQDAHAASSQTPTSVGAQQNRIFHPLPIVWRGGRGARLILVLLLIVAQTAYYFGTHLPRFNHEFRAADLAPDGQDAMFRAAGFPPGTFLHVISDPPNNAGFLNGLAGYLADGLEIRALTPADVTAQYLSTLPRVVDHAFFVMPDDTETVARIDRYFTLRPPETTPFNLPPGEAFTLYYAPAGGMNAQG
jgi:hypothetical protein